MTSRSPRSSLPPPLPRYWLKNEATSNSSKGLGGSTSGTFSVSAFRNVSIAVVVGDNRIVRQFFQNRVLDHLLIDHLPQFETVERQHADHLNQTRSKDLLLGHAEMKFWCQPIHKSQFRRKLSPR